LTLASCNLVQFGVLIEQQTGKVPAAYIRYGCYCICGGSKQPVDATNWCCHDHNCCYEKLLSNDCDPRTAAYQYASEQGGTVIACGTGDSCQRGACECDKKAVECFQKAASTYRKSYDNYPRSNCTGPTPSC
ncbi:PA2GE phospholipase, partial [Melanocharis versteri]|nr:PA2GE phospholipase [Melanocharis versteri]